MRKGFLHIVEIMIVSLMAFLVLLQFSYVPKQNIDWGGMKLSTQANDILFSVEKKGVDWFNSTAVDQTISSFVSKNTIYNLKIRNVMKRNINVGCICSAAETTSLANALGPFEINGQPVSFSVAWIDPSKIAFSHDYDVIVDFDYNLTNNYTQIMQFLGADKGIVEFRHLDQSKIDSVQADFFGLEWNSSLPSPGAGGVNTPAEFRSNESSDPYYNIYKYFHNIPIYQENFTSGSAGWLPQPGSLSDWNVNAQKNYAGVNSTAGGESITVYSTKFNDSYSLRAFFSIDNIFDRDARLILYWQDSNNYAFVEFDAAAGMVGAFEKVAGTVQARGFKAYALGAGSWYDAKIIPQADNTLKIYINRSLVLTSQPITLIPGSQSQIGLAVKYSQAKFDNIRVTFSEKHNFTNLLTDEKIQPADNNMQKAILSENVSLSACIVNSNIVDDKGRTAWLASGPGGFTQEINNMLRTLVVWAAGDEYYVINNEVRNVPVVNSLYKTYDQDMYQPVEVVLTMGNLYG